MCQCRSSQGFLPSSQGFRQRAPQKLEKLQLLIKVLNEGSNIFLCQAVMINDYSKYGQHAREI